MQIMKFFLQVTSFEFWSCQLRVKSFFWQEVIVATTCNDFPEQSGLHIFVGHTFAVMDGHFDRAQPFLSSTEISTYIL